MIAFEGRSGNSEAGFSLVAKTSFLKASISPRGRGWLGARDGPFYGSGGFLKDPFLKDHTYGWEKLGPSHKGEREETHIQTRILLVGIWRGWWSVRCPLRHRWQDQFMTSSFQILPAVLEKQWIHPLAPAQMASRVLLSDMLQGRAKAETCKFFSSFASIGTFCRCR